MLGKMTIGFFALALAARMTPATGEDEPAPTTEVVISVAEQRLVVLRDGMWVSKHRVSTSKFGLGDSFGSYKTPVGKLRVCEKIGDNFAPGAVIKHRHATGEILPVNAPGRDPIVTRVLWLDGLEERNKNSKSRGIYIHGTVEEAKIGSPVSYGCIRMRSREVTEVFETVPIGAVVTIQPERLANYRHWTPPAPIVVAATKTLTPTPPPPPAPAPEAPPLPKVATTTSTKATEVPEKRDPRTKGKVAAAPTLAAQSSEKTAARKDVASTAPSKTEPKPRVELGNAGSLSGSILFADLPSHMGKANAPETLESIRGPVLSPVGELSRKQPSPLPEESAPLPRVTFRTGPSGSSVPERLP